MTNLLSVMIIHPDDSKCIAFDYPTVGVGHAQSEQELLTLMAEILTYSYGVAEAVREHVVRKRGRVSTLHLKNGLESLGYDWEATLLANEMTGAYKPL